MHKIIIAYIPVLHEGYRKFLEKHSDAATLYIFGQGLIKKYDYLAKEIRQLDPVLIKKAIESWGVMDKVEILEETDLNKLKADIIIMPDEDVCKSLAGEYFSDKKISFDNIFLRWDKHKVMEEKPVAADQKMSHDDFDRGVIQKLKVEAQKSSDWWRRVGAAIIKDGKILLSTHNEHLPSPHSPYVDGDPRNTLHKGVGMEYSTAIHAEVKLIAEAAKQGVSLDGASVYVTVFPCPTCAKQIAFSGIKKLYYAGGYQILDQETVLRSKGVELVYVEM